MKGKIQNSLNKVEKVVRKKTQKRYIVAVRIKGDAGGYRGVQGNAVGMQRDAGGVLGDAGGYSGAEPAAANPAAPKPAAAKADYKRPRQPWQTKAF